MKKTALKDLVATVIGVIFILGGISSSFAGNSVINSPPGKYEKGTWTINNDLSNIKADRNNLEAIDDNLKKDCKAGNKTALITDKKEWLKSKADLKRDYAYLMADRKELINNQQLTVKILRNKVAGDKERLALSERMLWKSIAKQNTSDIQTDANLVAENQLLLKNDRVKLDNENKLLNSDVAYINNGRVKGKFMASVRKEVTAIENDFASL